MSALHDKLGQAELNEQARQQTERALREHQARLSAALATAKLGIWEYDHATGLTKWDERCREIFGWQDDQPRSNEEMLHLVHPEDRKRVASEIAAALDPVKGGLFDTEYRISHPDGTTRWVMVRGQAVLESPGNAQRPQLFTGTALDITANKQAGETLRRSEERFRLATFSDIITLYEQDAELRYTWLYPLHPEHANALGRSDAELSPTEEGQRLTEFKQEVMATGRSQRREVFSQVGGGRYYDVFISPRRDETGRVIGVAGAALDVTERKRFQSELERQVKELTAALQEMTDQLNAFVYTLAHDFKAPLKAQVAFAEILVEDFGDALGPTGRQFAERIAEAAKRQAALINSLLQQVSLSREDLPMESLPLREVLQQAQSELALEIESKQASVAVGAVDGCVWANRASLHLILSNLLTNALKFVPEGVKPAVKIWSEPATESPANLPPGSDPSPTGTIRLWVQDNGIGIRPADQLRLFQAFQRFASDPRYPGTGIGLAIVKKATERLGGRLGVESELGKGSRFWIELRAAGPQQPELSLDVGRGNLQPQG